MRVAGICSRPECRQMTIVPDPDYPAGFAIRGRASHIAAASPNGPRYDNTMTTQERRAVDNGIWLCGDCADLVDKERGRGFSVELLKSWKARAEEEVSNAALLRTAARRPAWLDKLRTPHYINLPRVLHLSADRLSTNAVEVVGQGFPDNGYIAPELSEVGVILRRLSIKAVDVEQLLRPECQVREGLVMSFYQRRRTRNGAQSDPSTVRNYSFSKSPLIYLDAHNFRYVFPYDPIWLTTNTAKSDVRSGTTTLAGIGIVKRVIPAQNTAICSPLAFGVPDLLGLFG